jgi:indole-3-glycerol phosphate synthase
MNILQTIVDRKKEEIKLAKSKVNESTLVQTVLFDRKCFSFSEYIIKPELSGIIAEFKRKSPSKPTINLHADITQVTTGYTSAGASALSVLTDVDFFGGNDEDLKQVRSVNQIPILRKDFVIDPYQILEAKSLGADAILLIAEILKKSEIDELSKVAVDFGLEVLMEVHTSDQISKYHERIKNIGVNNRNLKTFTTDIRYSMDIFPQLPSDTIKISESGLHDAATVASLKRFGFDGFLIGESFMKTEDPGKACADFIQKMNELS